VGEVFYRSFDNRRQLASFAGIAPSPWSSGSIARDQGISKAGSGFVRTTMIELAWLWLRYQPGSALSIWFRERVGDGKGRVRRIAIVALARELLVVLAQENQLGNPNSKVRYTDPRSINITPPLWCRLGLCNSVSP
jgi:transposase